MIAWTLVFHIIGLVFWIGTLLVVTRIMAMHSEETAPELRTALGHLEARLMRGFAHPGAALMVITGFMLAAERPEYLREYWLHIKLLLVVVLIALDLRVTFRVKSLREETIVLKRGECMALHGAIALLFFCIIILAVVKPFGTAHRHAELVPFQAPSKLPQAGRRAVSTKAITASATELLPATERIEISSRLATDNENDY